MGWRDGSVGKTPILQAVELEFNVHAHIKERTNS